MRLWCVMKNGFYLTTGGQPAQWLDWEEASKHFPKPSLHQNKAMVTGGLLSVWSTAAFWIPAKPLHLRSMLSKSMRCTKNCNACSQQWSTERAQFFSETMPNHTLHNQCFKFWMNWAMKFCRICQTHLTSLSPTHYHFFKHLNNFLQGKSFHNQQDAENAFQEFIKSQSKYF